MSIKLLYKWWKAWWNPGDEAHERVSHLRKIAIGGKPVWVGHGYAWRNDE